MVFRVCQGAALGCRESFPALFLPVLWISHKFRPLPPPSALFRDRLIFSAGLSFFPPTAPVPRRSGTAADRPHICPAAPVSEGETASTAPLFHRFRTNFDSPETGVSVLFSAPLRTLGKPPARPGPKSRQLARIFPEMPIILAITGGIAYNLSGYKCTILLFI